VPHKIIIYESNSATFTFLSNVACYLYPAYASYKALALTPINSHDATVQTERWLMYWAVVGCWTAIESVAWWLLYV
jgi:hypothetical protein